MPEVLILITRILSSGIPLVAATGWPQYILKTAFTTFYIGHYISIAFQNEITRECLEELPPNNRERNLCTGRKGADL